MNALVNSCASAPSLTGLSADELAAVSGGDRTPNGTLYSTALFDQRAVTGVLFYENGNIVAMVNGRPVGNTTPTGPKPM